VAERSGGFALDWAIRNSRRRERFFENGSLFSGSRTGQYSADSPAPPLQNKIYVSITLSDGDNVQYMQHHMKVIGAILRAGRSDWLDGATARGDLAPGC